MDPNHVKALKYLIRVAPAGEMQDVIHHLSTLAGSQEAMAQQLDLVAALRKWYETHRMHVPLPDDKVGLVTVAGQAGEAENGDFLYYDNILQMSFSFNPFTLASAVVSD